MKKFRLYNFVVLIFLLLFSLLSLAQVPEQTPEDVFMQQLQTDISNLKLVGNAIWVQTFTLVQSQQARTDAKVSDLQKQINQLQAQLAGVQTQSVDLTPYAKTVDVNAIQAKLLMAIDDLKKQISNPPPAYSGVIANINTVRVDTHTTQVSFTSADTSLCYVDYGTTTGYGTRKQEVIGPNTVHFIALDGLPTTGTVMHFKITCKNMVNVISGAPDMTFITP